MSDSSAAPATSWRVTATIAAIMVLLALLGVAFATTSARLARNYWVALVPVYGALCAFTAWRRAQAGGELLVLRQVLHWLGIAVAVALDFSVRGTGVETSVASGLDALLLLALGCYLAGIHLDWPFVLVGLLLSVTLVVVAKADQYMWLLFVIGLAAIAVLIALRRMRSGEGAPARP
jgi:hypothetical protein